MRQRENWEFMIGFRATAPGRQDNPPNFVAFERNLSSFVATIAVAPDAHVDAARQSERPKSF